MKKQKKHHNNHRRGCYGRFALALLLYEQEPA